jgi:hypothetical protein
MLRSFVARSQVRAFHYGTVGRAQGAAAVASGVKQWLPSHPPSQASVPDSEINKLAARPRRPLTLADLVKYARALQSMCSTDEPVDMANHHCQRKR